MTGDWFLYVVGGAILLLAAYAILKNNEIATGHAILVALGVAIIALPRVKDFEYGDGKVKFTTREEVAKIAASVQAVTEQQKALTVQLNDTTERVANALSTVNSQQSELEQALKSKQPDIRLNEIPKFNPGSWRDLMLRNDQIGRQADQGILKLDQMQKELIAPAQ
jgi:phosphomevalonate kinase